MNLRLGRIALNIAACLTFLSIPILLAPDANPTWDFMVHGETFRDLIAYSIMIIYFLCKLLLLHSELFFKKKAFTILPDSVDCTRIGSVYSHSHFTIRTSSSHHSS